MTKRPRRASSCDVRAPQVAFLIAALAPLAATMGCASRVRSPADARDALDRINANFTLIERALYCSPATVSFRFRDDAGRVHRFIGQPATVIFRAPHCLYFDIKSPLAGSVAHIGSSDERYWLWIDVPDEQTLWWGSWAVLAEGRARPLVVPPDRLLDALLLRPMPVRLPDGLPPLLVEDPDGTQRLLFQQIDASGWPYVAREMVLDGRTPYLPRRIIDRDADAAVTMHAELWNYRPVRDTGPDGPYIARGYLMRWDGGQTELRLDLLGVRYRTKDTPFCDFPEGWLGEQVPLDEPAPDLSALHEDEIER